MKSLHDYKGEARAARHRARRFTGSFGACLAVQAKMHKKCCAYTRELDKRLVAALMASRETRYVFTSGAANDLT